jgi:DNA polymerase-3 subunit epsilon
LRVGETEFAAIDFESAGARKGSTDVPVQIGIATCIGAATDCRTALASYLATDQPIVWSAQKVHGIRQEDLAGAPTLLELWPQISSQMQGRWVVAHGAATEKRFLRAFPFHGFRPWVDTLKLARAVWPDLPSHSLGDLIGQLGLDGEMARLYPAYRWHDAVSDALASLVLLGHVITVSGIAEEPAEILLRADDSHYHRAASLKGRAAR